MTVQSAPSITGFQPPIQRVTQPPWSRELYTRGKYRYKVPYGGRGSSKTWSVANALIVLAHQENLRVVCCREHQNSIQESAKKELEVQIERMGLGAWFNIRDHYISHVNGSYFFFRGLSTVQEDAIKGWADVDIVWVDEAEVMSKTSWEKLRNTIRKARSEIWITFNPRYRIDPVWDTFVRHKQDNAWVVKVNYHDNPWFPDSLEAERLACKRDFPERYAHIWLGEPDDEGEERLVLPYALTRQCVEAWSMYRSSPDPQLGVVHAGLDIADTGSNKNSLSLRRGPALYRIDRWAGVTLGNTARRANQTCVDQGVTRMYFDAGGPGAGVRSYLKEMESGLTYRVEPVNFGGEVKAGQVRYAKGQTNKQFFSKRNAQLGWSLRLRANHTKRLVEGEKIAHDKCLFINPDIPDLEDILAQMTQPQWDEDTAGRMRIHKIPEKGLESPDSYDSTILAFGRDSQRGLTNPV